MTLCFLVSPADVLWGSLSRKEPQRTSAGRLGAFPTEGFKSCVCSAPW